MGVGAGMYDVVVKNFTFAISSSDEFLLYLSVQLAPMFFSLYTLEVF